MTIDPTRQLVVHLGNLVAKAREAAAREDIEKVKVTLAAAQTAASLALLAGAKRKSGVALAKKRR